MKKYLLLTLLTLAIISCEEEIPVYTVTVSSSPSEGGSVSPQGGEYEQGQTASFTATPNEFYEFSGWSGADTSTINPVSIIVDTNKSLTARFEKLDTDNDGITDDIDQCPDTPANEQADSNGCSVSQKDFELSISVEGEGTVTEEVVVAPTIYQGTTQVQLTAVPAEGWEFTEWTGNATGTDNPITIEIDGTKNITAVFTKKDTDGDGVPDLEDTCADTPSGEEADENGCSLSQKDSDGDGVTDDVDQCPDTPEGEEADENGCAPSQKDTDSDGVTDDLDQCPNTPEGADVDSNGCRANPIYLDENGITIKANEWAQVGSVYVLDGISYKVVDEALLREMVAANDDVTKVVTTKVTDMSHLFAGKTFNRPIGNWDVSNVTTMERMFYNSNFNNNIQFWDVTKVTNMNYMFNQTPFNKPIGDWNVSNVEDMAGMFGASSFNQEIGDWNVSNVWDFDTMFRASPFDKDISNWNTSSAILMSEMFKQTPFNQPIGAWDTSKVTSMREMFRNSSFNQNIASWDTSSLLEMNGMFRDSQFNHDINNWDVEKVTNFSQTFMNADAFNSDISDWNTISAENMSSMFANTDIFNQDISNWNVSNVTNMNQMFGNADGFNIDIGDWNVSNVMDMDYMFRFADVFNQDISVWCVSNFAEEPTEFKSGSPLTDANSPVWGTCPINPGLVTAVKTSSGTSQSCTNGVCTTFYSRTIALKNQSGKTILLNKIDIVFDTYTIDEDINAEILDGNSRSISLSTEYSGSLLFKFYWTYEGVEYITEYQD